MLIDQIKKQITAREAISITVKPFVLLSCFLLFLASYSVAHAKQLDKVVRVVDGDTVVLMNGQKVRLLSINTPELGYNSTAPEGGGLRAKKFLKRLVLNKRVLVEQDIEYEDRYGRRLAHLFLENGLHINMEMLQTGQATLNIHPPNLKYTKSLLLAQHLAEDRRVGLWSLAAYQVKPAEYIAARKLERWGRFTGQVEKITSLKKGTKLWLNRNVYIWIGARNAQYFLAMDSYNGRHIEIRGWPKQRGKYWSISAIHPSQLLVAP